MLLQCMRQPVLLHAVAGSAHSLLASWVILMATVRLPDASNLLVCGTKALVMPNKS